MQEPESASGAELAGLLDDHLRVSGRRGHPALPIAAIRTRCLDARHLIARAALRDQGSLADLLRAARDADRAWLRKLSPARPRGLAAVAQTLAMQDELPDDRRDALAVYDLVRTALGPAALPAGHQALHAQLAFHWRGHDEARELLAAYPDMTAAVRRDLECDLGNPFVGPAGRPIEPWLAAFRELLPAPWPVLGVEDHVPPFDRLAAPAIGQRVDAPHRVSVIVTAYRPDRGLITAVRSVLAQSWSNVEVIIVDDASPPEYDDVLKRAAALGPRVHLVRQPANLGTYAARNAGLDASAGEFVTFQDSDDWSHPRRLELQVRALLADHAVVASTSDGVSVTDTFVLTRPGMRSCRLNPSSLLFRRNLVLGRIGYFDNVRKAADSEYIGRIRAAFGESAVRHLAEGPLALIRLSRNSLSRSEIRPFWMHPARAAYSSAYLWWHDRIAKGRAHPYRGRDQADRPFAAPAHLRLARQEHPAGRAFDVVVAADWRWMEGGHEAAVAEMTALRDAGLRVAVAHMEGFRTVSRRREPLAGTIQHLINDGHLEAVGPEEKAETGLLIVRQPTVLQFPPSGRWELRPRRTMIVADRAPARDDGEDRRYLPGACAAAARRLFGVDPLWCPQDAGVRAALQRAGTSVLLTDFDLPTVVDGESWASPRGRRSGKPVVGTDLADQGVWPTDLTDAVAVFDELTSADVRLRLPDGPPAPDGAVRTPARLVYEAADLDPRAFLHQLDFYLHFPHHSAAELFSRPALHAAAIGCVVVTTDRYASFFGDAAVYCEPDQVRALIHRYHRDQALFREQSRRAREVALRAHHPRLLVDRITDLLAATRSPVRQRAETAGGVTLSAASALAT